MDILEKPICELAGVQFSCGCGRVHQCRIETILLGSGVLLRGADVLAGMGKKALLIADINTWECAGKRMQELLAGRMEVVAHVYPDRALVPDERALGSGLMALPEQTDLLIAVGSGTLNDLTRYMSLMTGIPYAAVCTAPSMDGYASVVAPLIRAGVKITFPGVYPKVIVADTDILKDAPKRMLSAGYGDVMGKITALLDWRLSCILLGEYRCDAVMGLVQKAVDRTIAEAEALRRRESGGVEAVMEALLATGICIGFVGFSRPASGSEHHISHFLEMTELMEGKPMEWLHGNHVGMGTGAILRLYQYLAGQDMGELMERGAHRNFNLGQWAARLDAGFGPLSPAIKESRRAYQTDDAAQRDSMMESMVNKWGTVRREVLDGVMDFDAYREAMESAGAEWHPRDMGIDRDTFRQALILAKEVRTRYGILQTLEDAGILEQAADWVTEQYYG